MKLIARYFMRRRRKKMLRRAQTPVLIVLAGTLFVGLVYWLWRRWTATEEELDIVRAEHLQRASDTRDYMPSAPTRPRPRVDLSAIGQELPPFLSRLRSQRGDEEAQSGQPQDNARDSLTMQDESRSAGDENSTATDQMRSMPESPEAESSESTRASGSASGLASEHQPQPAQQRAEPEWRPADAPPTQSAESVNAGETPSDSVQMAGEYEAMAREAHSTSAESLNQSSTEEMPPVIEPRPSTTDYDSETGEIRLTDFAADKVDSDAGYDKPDLVQVSDTKPSEAEITPTGYGEELGAEDQDRDGGTEPSDSAPEIIQFGLLGQGNDPRAPISEIDLAAADDQPMMGEASSLTAGARDDDELENGTKPFESAGAREDVSGDDQLEQVNGIGMVYADRLRAAGIGALEDLANSSPDQLENILNIPKWRKIDYEGWIEQAKQLSQSGTR